MRHSTCPSPRFVWDRHPPQLCTFPPRAIFAQNPVRGIRNYVSGLLSPDSVSCYANASLQSLLHCDSVRRLVSRQNGSDVLSETLTDYCSASFVDMKNLRKYAGIAFLAPQQQDVPEFLSYLLTQSGELRSLFEHKLVTSRRCSSCGNETSSAPMINYILPAVSPENYKQSNLQTMIDFNVGNWKETELRCGVHLLPEEDRVQIVTKEDVVSA
ncbi:hypothetical protein QAD02_013758 [Eretmocerus hayati]|uniref:Uncharacterized protein n=1 Tax=Eretmocerus hayati TaxID=131215 RepID=A0ACC2P4G8_9HYME|nr:hypothetical protein QAD02_013758 [Eretmocerus hayati]